MEVVGVTPTGFVLIETQAEIPPLDARLASVKEYRPGARVTLGGGV
jgi:hypothetical protein